MGAASLKIDRANHLVAAFFKKDAALGPVGPGAGDQLAIDKHLGKADDVNANAVGTAGLGCKAAGKEGGKIQCIGFALGDMADLEGLVLGANMYRIARQLLIGGILDGEATTQHGFEVVIGAAGRVARPVFAQRCCQALPRGNAIMGIELGAAAAMVWAVLALGPITAMVPSALSSSAPLFLSSTLASAPAWRISA